MSVLLTPRLWKVLRMPFGGCLSGAILNTNRINTPMFLISLLRYDISMLATKSVDSPIDREVDGLRILATRFRGRGLPSSRYDIWMPSLGPSERLLKSIQTRKIAWAEFAREYRAELFMDGRIDSRSQTIKNHGQKFTLRLLERLSRHAPVTLLCHCAEDQQHCHRHLLRKLILSSRI